MSSSSNRAHRLASHSRKRRLIALARSKNCGPDAPHPESIRPTGQAPSHLEVVSGSPSSPSAASRQRAGAVLFQPFRELLEARKPAVWVFAGDGITLGARHTDGQRSYCEHFAERIRSGLGRTHDVVINTAAAGETAQSLLDDFEWRTLRFQPDVVSVMIGINDAATGPSGRAEFARNLQHIVECIRAEGSLALLHTLPWIDGKRVKTHKDLPRYMRLVRDVAAKLDVACIDHWAYWKRKSAARSESIHGWLVADGLNPTAKGHRALAKLLCRRLGIFNERPRRALGYPH